MNNINPEQRNWIYFIIIISISIFGLIFFVRYYNQINSVDEIDEPIVVSLVITSHDWTIRYENISTLNNTVYKILLECADYYNITVKVDKTHQKLYESVFIESINGTANKEKYWQFYVNNEYGNIGSENKEIFNGDIIEWKFEKPRQ